MDSLMSISPYQRFALEKKIGGCRCANNMSIFLSHYSPVFHKVEFYCLGQHGNSGVFNPNGAYWRVLDIPHKQPQLLHPKVPHERNFLLECDGELLSISFMGKLFSVSKLDSVERAWHEVDCLGDQMLFVSNTSSLLAKRVVQGMKNKVYLLRINGKCGVFYSLTSGLFQTFGNDFSHKDLFGTTEVLNCYWIEPKDDISYSKEELNWIEDT
ncbi:hypothetical protein Vadar_026732 [Vaccinium darrowii]|uniref:Uncharacterized protein n=1 Tax=Vaccinium darrowii TaxID=229202 RepID=A0ACB7Z7X3_9ERIC|nr:hypothetical protein Vadar_026732 [Vaccinium darrowii]